METSGVVEEETKRHVDRLDNTEMCKCHIGPVLRDACIHALHVAQDSRSRGITNTKLLVILLLLSGKVKGVGAPELVLQVIAGIFGG